MPLPSCRACRRGFTLTELAVVLGVVGIIIAGIWTAASRVQANNKVMRASAQFTQILGNYRTLYAQHSIDVADWTDITCTGVNADFFPADVLPNNPSCTPSASGTTTYKGSALINPWSGAIKVWAYASNPGIVIGYFGLTQAACGALAAIVTQSPDMIWEQIDNSNGQYVQPVANNLPWDPVALNGQCTAAGSGNEVQVMFRAN